MIKEIGSTYFLDPAVVDTLPKKSLKQPDILHADERYVSTCRSAIGLCLDTLSDARKVALLPAFTCESVLGPFLKRGYEVYPYPIGRDFHIHWESFSQKVEEVKPSVILTHPYFGFNSTKELRERVAELRESGIIMIEDMTQSMFSSFEPLPTNFHVGSIRKWMPVPDGAFTTSPANCTDEDTELANAKLKAFSEKGDYLLHGNGEKAEFRKNFGIAEGILDSREHAYSMSSASREIFASINIDRMKKTRWNNYFHLDYTISHNPILSANLQVVFSNPARDVCPFHFTVMVKEGRRELQQHLASNDIYATVIWGCPEEFEQLIDEDARFIYEHVLCFHVDQRYDEHDMDRIINVLNDFFTK